MSRAGMLIRSPDSMSVMLRSLIASETARRIWLRKRRMNRCRFTALLFFPFSRRSIIWGTVAHPSVRLAYAQVPLREQAHLLLRITLVHHPADEAFVLLHVFGCRLRVEGDDREKLFGVGEHLLLDHLAELLVAGPVRVLAVVLGAGTQD